MILILVKLTIKINNHLWMSVMKGPRTQCEESLSMAWISSVLLAKASEFIAALGMMPKWGHPTILCPVSLVCKMKAALAHLISKLLSRAMGLYLNNSWHNWFRTIKKAWGDVFADILGDLVHSIFISNLDGGWWHSPVENWQWLKETMLVLELRVEKH